MLFGRTCVFCSSFPSEKNHRPGFWIDPQVNVFRDDIRVGLAPNVDTSRDSLAAQHFRDSSLGGVAGVCVGGVGGWGGCVVPGLVGGGWVDFSEENAFRGRLMAGAPFKKLNK